MRVDSGEAADEKIQSLRHQYGKMPALWNKGVKPTQLKGPSGLVYDGTTFGCLSPGTEPRRSAIWLVENRWFDTLILLVIFANTFTMAWEAPLDPPGTRKEMIIAQCEMIFLGVFTFEMFLKVLAFGLYRNMNAYLRQPWCQLDFLVVAFAWAPIIFGDIANFSVIRTVRALRPLRALKRFPGMPVLVNAVMSTLPKLLNVIGFIFAIFFVFAIVGVELFSGLLHYRCALPGFDASLPGAPELYTELPDGVTHPFGLPSQLDFDTGEACSLVRSLSADGTVVSAGGSVTDGLCHHHQSCEYFVTNPEEGITCVLTQHDFHAQTISSTHPSPRLIAHASLLPFARAEAESRAGGRSDRSLILSSPGPCASLTLRHPYSPLQVLRFRPRGVPRAAPCTHF